MHNTVNKTFSIQATITKCYTVQKDDGTERYVIEGLASGTEIDLTNEQMAESAIDSMVACVKTHKIELNNEHRPEWDSVYGEITDIWKTETADMMVRAELKPWHYRTITLVKSLEEGAQIALSIEGKVVEAALEWSDELKRMIKVYKDILLEKISTTGTPAYAKSWLTNINKSVTDWKETPMPKPLALPVKKTDVITEADDEQPTIAASEDTVETPESATPPSPDTTAQDTPSEGTEEGVETQAPADEPVAPAAPAQEATAEPSPEEAAKSTPEPATGDTSTVAKAAVLGEWAEADVVWDAVDSLSRNLKWFVWGTMLEGEKTTEEKQAAIAAALAEFSALITTVSSAMLANGIDEETVKSVEATKSQTPEALAKSLSERDAKVEELAKAIEAKAAEVAAVTKTLGEMTTELENVQKSLKAETEAKQQAETELTTIKARKVLAFSEAAQKAVVLTDPAPNVEPTTTMPSKRLQGVY